jgi:hypothetical protein
MDLRKTGSEDGRWTELVQIMPKYKVLVIAQVETLGSVPVDLFSY